jgi:aspartokinase
MELEEAFMESVSDMVKYLLENKPFLLDALSRGILSLGNLASEFKPDIEKSLGKDIKETAIVMALRRYGDEIREHQELSVATAISGEILMKTNICDFNVQKSTNLLGKLKNLYEMVNIARGDFLNVIIGNNEVSISVSEKYYSNIELFLSDEKVFNYSKGLVSLTVIFDGDFLHTPGIVSQVMHQFAWENINIFEIISTMTELTLVIENRNSIKGYEVLQKYLEYLQNS